MNGASFLLRYPKHSRFRVSSASCPPRRTRDQPLRQFSSLVTGPVTFKVLPPNYMFTEPNSSNDSPNIESEFIIRGPAGLKGRAVGCSRKRNMKLTPWLIEAVEDKLAKEEAPIAFAIDQLKEIRLIDYDEIDMANITTGRFGHRAMTIIKKITEVPGVSEKLGYRICILSHEIGRLMSSDEIKAHADPKEWLSETVAAMRTHLNQCIALLEEKT